MTCKSYEVKGKSINELLNIDLETFNRLDERSLKKVVSRLASASNKRLRRFEKAGIETPATVRVQKSGGDFSVKSKGLNALRSEYVRAAQFLKAKTGTRRGWEKVRRETVETLRKRGIEVDKSQLDDLWHAYDMLKELSPEVASRYLKYDVLQNISELVTTTEKTPDEIAVSLREEIGRIYEERGRADAIGGVSGFFEF